MNHILYLMDKNFNLLAKFEFEKESMVENYISEHLNDETKPNMILINFDEYEEIESVLVYKEGKLSHTHVVGKQ